MILMEIESGDTKKTYIHADSQIMAQYDGDHTASRYFYLHDRLGSVRQIIDTSGYVEGMNLYTYCGNNPINWADPYGLWQWTIGGAYGLGGRITFGKNKQRWNVGIAFGYGLGGIVEYTPGDIVLGVASEGIAGNIGVEVSGKVKSPLSSGSIGLRGRTEFDSATNVETRVGLIGGITVLPTKVMNLSGSADSVVRENIDMATCDGTFELTRNPISYSVGGMSFGGVTAGAVWDAKPK